MISGTNVNDVNVYNAVAASDHGCGFTCPAPIPAAIPRQTRIGDVGTPYAVR